MQSRQCHECGCVDMHADDCSLYREPPPQDPGRLTPNGIAILTMMNGDYRRKVIAALKNVRDRWDHLDGETQAIDACIEAIREINLVD